VLGAAIGPANFAGARSGWKEVITSLEVTVDVGNGVSADNPLAVVVVVGAVVVVVVGAVVVGVPAGLDKSKAL
jgi:hypothetical protein